MVTRRQKRRLILARLGFLPFEVKEFSAVSRAGVKIKLMNLEAPYIKEMMINRRNAFKLYKDLSPEERKLTYSWAKSIRNMYQSKGCLTVTGKPDFWKLFRQFEEDYKKKHPEYDPDYPEFKRKKPKTHELFEELYAAGLEDKAKKAEAQKRLTPLERYDRGRGR